MARIPPGGPGEIGRLNYAIAKLTGLAVGSAPPNLFTTLARHRKVFRKWLRFASALMPGGALPRDESELLILRVAHNTGSEYEWRYHERIALYSGLTADDVSRVREGAAGGGWSQRRGLLLQAADELHHDRRISDETWGRLRPLLTDAQLIEVCLLVGHYEMLAMMLNSLEVQPDLVRAERTPAMRALQAIGKRGRADTRSDR